MSNWADITDAEEMLEKQKSAYVPPHKKVNKQYDGPSETEKRTSNICSRNMQSNDSDWRIAQGRKSNRSTLHAEKS